MTEEPTSPAEEWLIRPAQPAPFVYDPRVHTRLYVREYAERVSAQILQDILEQADELDRRAVARGYQLASEEHVEEVSQAHPPRFEPPGPHQH